MKRTGEEQCATECGVGDEQQRSEDLRKEEGSEKRQRRDPECFGKKS